MVTSTGNSSCVGHRGPNASASPVVNAPAIGAIITTAAIDALRAGIQIEIARWQQHARYASVTSNGFYTAVTAGIVSGSIADEMPTVNSEDEALKVVGGPGSLGNTVIPNPSAYPPGASVASGTADVDPALIDNSFPVGSYITAADYQKMLTNYNNLKADCICNSDCNCNAVCSCHGNCGCNYSDMRLKMEICYC